MNDLGITPADRVAVAARQKAEEIQVLPQPLNCQMGKSWLVKTLNFGPTDQCHQNQLTLRK